MSYAGLDLSRRKLDVHVLDEGGVTVGTLAVHPDADALRTLAGGHRRCRHVQLPIGASASHPATTRAQVACAVAVEPDDAPETAQSLPATARVTGSLPNSDPQDLVPLDRHG